MAWKPTANQLLWGAVSRAVRAPARIDRELFVPGIQPHVVLAGGPNFDSEIAHVAELGYRAQPMGGLS
jgi:iron complex outermembrane receptor protein